jgi:ribosomal protein S27E
MTEAELAFSITTVEWEYQPSSELGEVPRQRKRNGPRVLGIHCHQCGADLTLTKSPAGPAPGFFYLVPGFVYIGCPECSAERTVSWAEIEVVGQ